MCIGCWFKRKCRSGWVFTLVLSGKYDNGATSFDFLFAQGFTTSMSISCCHPFFVSIMVMIHSSRLQCNCRQWRCSFLFGLALRYYLFWLLVHCHYFLKRPQSNLCTTQNLEWNLSYVSSSHVLCSYITSMVVIRNHPSRYPLEVADWCI